MARQEKVELRFVQWWVEHSRSSKKKIRLYEGMYVGMYVEPLYPDLKAWCVGVWCVGVWCVGVGLCRRGSV